MDQQLVPIMDAAKALGVGRTTLYGMLADGTLESVRLGHRRLVVAESIKGLVQKLRENGLHSLGESDGKS